MKILLAWIGDKDLLASTKKGFDGPILNACKEIGFNEVSLLSDRKKKDNEEYVKWLKEKAGCNVSCKTYKLSSPTHHEDIWNAVTSHLKNLTNSYPDAELYFHLTPGTPSMHAVWLLIGRTYYPANLIQTSIQKGMEIADLPFDIAVEYVSAFTKKYDKKIEAISTGKPPEFATFHDIIYRSHDVEKSVIQAQRVAPRNYPVLLEGESGTGKELFARAIHNESLRKDKPFVPVNCGAIPENLLEAELFGYEKGSFTGADKQKNGLLETAHGGTVFLDEIGDMPLQMQVKLLRFLEVGKLRRIGADKEIDVDVRIISATHKNLLIEISKNNFREDLFYRIAVEIINLPPLRKRKGDITILAKHIIQLLNEESAKLNLKYEDKKTLSAGGLDVLLTHSWPGNIRELLNTLKRAYLRSEGSSIKKEEMRDSLLMPLETKKEDFLDIPFDEKFKLDDILKQIEAHYLKKAFEESGNNYSKAAKLAGLSNYQTFKNRLNKHH